MKYETIDFRPVVFTALDSLRRGRGEVMAEIEDLVNDPETRGNVEKSDWVGAPFMLIPSVDSGLRVYFRTDARTRTVEVVDLIRPEALRSIFAVSGQGNPPQ